MFPKNLDVQIEASSVRQPRLHSRPGLTLVHDRCLGLKAGGETAIAGSSTPQNVLQSTAISSLNNSGVHLGVAIPPLQYEHGGLPRVRWQRTSLMKCSEYGREHPRRSDVLCPEPTRVLYAAPRNGEHVLIQGNSELLSPSVGFGLVLTSPPYFHPRQQSVMHGEGYVGSLEAYVEKVSSLLVRCSASTRQRRLCFVKTDVWNRGELIPVSLELARACCAKGLRIRNHLIFKRCAAYSPYGPTFSNVFVFADLPMRPHCSGVIDLGKIRRRPGLPSSYTPELFAELMLRFSEPGDVVLDPFAGAGAVFHAAISTGRSSVGIDCSATQIARARQAFKNHSTFRIIESPKKERLGGL